jgi:hypothetical protein
MDSEKEFFASFSLTALEDMLFSRVVIRQTSQQFNCDPAMTAHGSLDPINKKSSS